MYWKKWGIRCMNKWFIIYCCLMFSGLIKNTISVGKATENDAQEWIISLVFIVLAVIKIGIVYLAVREGF